MEELKYKWLRYCCSIICIINGIMTLLAVQIDVVAFVRL